MTTVIGYRRVSSAGQNLDRQELPDVTGRVFEEKATGANRDRPQLYEMIEYVRDGDEVHVHSIDRLARSLRDLEDIVGEIIGKGASIRFLKEGLHFRPDEKTDPFQKLMFQMLGSFAEFERSLIASRRDEGIAKAKAEGKYKGRQATIDGEIIYELAEARRLKADDIAKIMGIGRASVYRILKDQKKLVETEMVVTLEKQVEMYALMLSLAKQGHTGNAIADNLDHPEGHHIVLGPWINKVLEAYPTEAELDLAYQNTKVKLEAIDDLYHGHGPVEYNPRRMQWLLDHGKGHDVMSERTGMPIEAIPSLIKAHKEQHQS